MTTPKSEPSVSKFGRFRPGREDLIDAGFLVGLSILALVGFRTTYAGINYLIVGVAGLFIGIVLAHIANVLRQPLIVLAVMVVAVFFLVGGALAARAQAAGGVFPTPGTFQDLASASIYGWKQLLTTLPPVDSSGPLLAIPYILGIVGGVGGFTMARRLRSPALPVLAPGGILIAVILLGTARPAAQFLQGTVFGVVSLVWIASRGTRLRPPVQNGGGRRARWISAAALLGATVVVATLIGPHLPGSGEKRVVLRSYVTPPFDISAFPSPLVGFRKYTKAADTLWDQTLFTVEGLPSGTFIRLSTLDSYNGSVWGATSGTMATADGAPQDSFARVGSTIDSGASGTPVTLKVTVEAADAAGARVNAWFPHAGTATSVSFSGSNAKEHESQFRYNLATTEGILPDRLKTGDEYTIHVVLGTADESAAELSPTALPYGTPTLPSGAYGFTSAQAIKWSSEATGSIPQLIAVAKHLVDSGAFSDGGEGESQYLPGHSLARLSANFLNDKQPVGDDEQYAAAFALLANQVGVPARVILGAEPEADGTVKGRDVHTWVSVHLSDGTWQSIPRAAFMPPTTKAPDKKLPDTIQNADAAVVPPPNPVRPPSALDFSLQQDAATAHANTNHRVGSGWQIPGFVVTFAKWTLPPILLISAICGLIIGLKSRRRKRRRTLGSSTTRISNGWTEIVDSAADLGVVLPAGQTRREDASRLAAYEVTDLANDADARVFGPGEPADDDATDYWRRVDELRQSMTSGLSRLQRWRVALSLRSLRSRSARGKVAFQ
jgi:hypothetical protein